MADVVSLCPISPISDIARIVQLCTLRSSWTAIEVGCSMPSKVKSSPCVLLLSCVLAFLALVEHGIYSGRRFLLSVSTILFPASVRVYVVNVPGGIN